MMRSDTVANSQLESGVTVMRCLIHGVQKRGAAVATDRMTPVASRAMGEELLFAEC
jgi:hypothetical protein